MPVSDISHITKTYIELIRREFVNSPAWSGPVPDILPVAPINLKDGVGFYLYHVIQKKEYGSFPVPVREPEARFLPMALTLYYQLTAANSNDDDNAAYNEQLMMSIAMKAIYDCPVIDDTTLVPEIPNNPPTLVLNANIRGNENRFHISQQPVPYTEAVHNWTAGQVPMKFSAYYEVSTAFLEQDDPGSYAGRVLAYGNYVLLKGAPRISSSQNTITYNIPGELTAREVKVQPAQAPPSPPLPAPVLPSSVITFYGSGFESGDISLRLLHPRFKETVVASADWAIAVTGSASMQATVRETAMLEKNNAPVTLLPGVYSVQVVITKTIHLANGLSHVFKNSSNQFPFIISPRIDPVAPLVANIFTVTGYIFQFVDAGTDLLEGMVEVYIGEKKLERSIVAPAADEFQVISPSQMQVNFGGALTPGMQVPFRVLINGVESQPQWLTV